MRSCLDLLWRAQLQELEKVRNIKSGLKVLSHRQFRIEPPPPTALTLLFSIFILIATLFLAFVPTLRLNHWLHSFLGFLGLLKGPHVGGAPSFAAVLRLSCGQHLINQHRQDKKKKMLVNEASLPPFSFSHLQCDTESCSSGNQLHEWNCLYLRSILKSSSNS